LPLCGGGADGVAGDCDGRPLLPEDGGLVGAPVAWAVLGEAAAGG
jgi:hypothetical protein